jgi:hypothetical protein
MTNPFETYEKQIADLKRELRVQKQLTQSVAQLSRTFLFDFVDWHDDGECVSDHQALIVLLDSVIDSTKEVK